VIDSEFLSVRSDAGPNACDLNLWQYGIAYFFRRSVCGRSRFICGAPAKGEWPNDLKNAACTSLMAKPKRTGCESARKSVLLPAAVDRPATRCRKIFGIVLPGGDAETIEAAVAAVESPLRKQSAMGGFMRNSTGVVADAEGR